MHPQGSSANLYHSRPTAALLPAQPSLLQSHRPGTAGQPVHMVYTNYLANSTEIAHSSSSLNLLADLAFFRSPSPNMSQSSETPPVPPTAMAPHSTLTSRSNSCYSGPLAIESTLLHHNYLSEQYPCAPLPPIKTLSARSLLDPPSFPFQLGFTVGNAHKPVVAYPSQKNDVSRAVKEKPAPKPRGPKSVKLLEMPRVIGSRPSPDSLKTTARSR